MDRLRWKRVDTHTLTPQPMMMKMMMMAADWCAATQTLNICWCMMWPSIMEMEMLPSALPLSTTKLRETFPFQIQKSAHTRHTHKFNLFTICSSRLWLSLSLALSLILPTVDGLRFSTMAVVLWCHHTCVRLIEMPVFLFHQLFYLVDMDTRHTVSIRCNLRHFRVNALHQRIKSAKRKTFYVCVLCRVCAAVLARQCVHTFFVRTNWQKQTVKKRELFIKDAWCHRFGIHSYLTRNAIAIQQVEWREESERERERDDGGKRTTKAMPRILSLQHEAPATTTTTI